MNPQRLMGNTGANSPSDFIDSLKNLQKECGVDNLKMSDYGITPDEFDKFAKNAKDAMSFLFANDRVQISEADCVSIYKESYK